jgi:hypothetical protein
MSVASLPTGEWTGHYTYSFGGGSAMDLCLDFCQGSIWGTASDAGGASTIRGSYDEHGRVTWVKRYAGHSVLYSGTPDGDSIVGTWLIHPRGHGTFRIRPVGRGQAVATEARATEREPAGVS